MPPQDTDSTRDIVIELRTEVKALTNAMTEMRRDFLATLDLVRQDFASRLTQEIRTLTRELEDVKARGTSNDQAIQKLPDSEDYKRIEDKSKELEKRVESCERDNRNTADLSKRVMWLAGIAGSVMMLVIGALASAMLGAK